MRKARDNDIAIIGMSVDLPSARCPEDFWESLVQGRDCVTHVHPERWDPGIYYSPQIPAPGKTYSKWAGFMDGPDRFDAAYFKLSPGEAGQVDPMQRIMLELTVNTLESSGYGGDKLWNTNTGVFIGASNSRHFHDTADINNPFINGMHYANAMIANRVSYQMNFHGPSETIDTICSSTLAAVHRACQSLKSGESDMALAGGISLLSSVDHFIIMSQMRLLSPEGRCKCFDETADGFALAEGAGLFLLKPVKNALQDKDHIWGIVKGSAVSHSGYTSNITMPSAKAISDMITAAYKEADIAPDTVSMIETNSAGFVMGDSIEVKGLKQAFGEGTRKSCALCSVKTNVGNMESASGVAAIAKILLAMKHGKIPGNLHFETLNPLIRLEKSPFYICKESRDWPVFPDTPRRAGVSAFGIGGANVHIILEAPEPDLSFVTSIPPGAVRQHHVLCLSAASLKSLKMLCTEYYRYLAACDHISLDRLCMTHNCGRAALPHRIAVIALSVNDLLKKLGTISEPGSREWSKIEGVVYVEEPMSCKRTSSARKKNALKSFLNASGAAGSLKRPGGKRLVFVFDDFNPAYPATRTFKHQYETARHLNDNGILQDDSIGFGFGRHTSRVVCNPNDYDRAFEQLSGTADPDVLRHQDVEPAVDPAVLGKNGVVVCVLISNRRETGSVKKIIKEGNPKAVIVESPLIQEFYNTNILSDLTAALFVNGVRIDFQKRYASSPLLPKMVLPPYPFDRQVFKNETKSLSVPPAKPGRQPVYQDSGLEEIRSLAEPDAKKRLERFFIDNISRLLAIDPFDIEVTAEFHEFGIDSIFIVKMLDHLATVLSIRVDPMAFSRYPTLSALSGYLTADIFNADKDACKTENGGDTGVELRDASFEHFHLISAWLSDAAVTQWLDPFFHNAFDAKRYGFFLKGKDKKTYVIEHQNTPVGICGMTDIDLNNRSCEAWMAICDLPSRARGIAFAAGERLMEKVFIETGLKTAILKIRADNKPALAMAEYSQWHDIGLLQDSLCIEGRFYDRRLFQMTRSRFRQREINI